VDVCPLRRCSISTGTLRSRGKCSSWPRLQSRVDQPDREASRNFHARRACNALNSFPTVLRDKARSRANRKRIFFHNVSKEHRPEPPLRFGDFDAVPYKCTNYLLNRFLRMAKTEMTIDSVLLWCQIPNEETIV